MKKNKKNIKKTKIQEYKELIILIIVALTVKTCLIEIYVVPTGSMEKTILIGDMLIGNKFVYGMKIPDWIGIPYTRYGYYLPIYKRLPKFKDIETGDVVIFEFPRDPFQKYVKRCIGLPSDRVSINNGNIKINNEDYSFKGDGQFLPKFSQLDFPYGNNHRDMNRNWIIYKNILADSSALQQYTKSYSPNAEKWDSKTKIPGGNLLPVYIGKMFDERNVYTYFAAELFDTGINGNYKNHVYNETEIFVDRGNGKYDTGEDYIDKNLNGQYDYMEDFTDIGNGRWDKNEFFYNMDMIDLHSHFKSESFYNEKYDINLNKQWDYGNEDNIEEFIVPHKGMKFDFSKIDKDYKGNWIHIIYMLLLDKNIVSLKINNKASNSIDEYEFVVESPLETARLQGILKYELSKIFARVTGGDLNNVESNRREEISENTLLLKSENIKNKKLNPWQLNQFKDIESDSIYLQISDLEDYLNFDMNVIDNKDFKIDPYKHIYINNIPIEAFVTPYELKYDYYFMVGDNRNNSFDSRFWGFVPEYHILGTPVISLINLGKIKPRFKIIK